MVSAAKLRRAQEAVVAARPYADKMQEVLSSLAMREEADGHPLLVAARKGAGAGGAAHRRPRPVRRLQRQRQQGRRTLRQGEAEGYEGYDLMIVGRKGRDYLKSRAGISISKVYENITGSISYSTAALIGQEVIEQYVAGNYDAVFFVFNAFRSAISQDVTIDKLLPIVPKQADEGAARRPTTSTSRAAARSWSRSCPSTSRCRSSAACSNRSASEHGARMSAMDSASKNASEMIGKLTLQYNRARQAAITKELMEIISGAESIK